MTTMGPMQETRQKMIEQLRLRGAQTVEDLVEALQVTRTAVTAHLRALQGEGLVIRHGLRPGRRRPSTLYALTPKADGLFPKAYDAFAAALLAELRRERPGRLSTVLRRVADGWIRRDLPRVEGLGGVDRLARVRKILAERGFLPVLERTAEGYLLREYNCPLMDLAQQHPEVCDMVHRWLEALAGTPLVRVKCLRRGDPYSAYAVGRPIRATSSS